MSTPPITQTRFSDASDVAILPSEPNQSSAMLSSRNATANVAISITSGDCVRSGRKTSHSIASDSASTTAKQSRIDPHSGQFHCEPNAIANAPAMIIWP